MAHIWTKNTIIGTSFKSQAITFTIRGEMRGKVKIFCEKDGKTLFWHGSDREKMPIYLAETSDSELSDFGLICNLGQDLFGFRPANNPQRMVTFLGDRDKLYSERGQQVASGIPFCMAAECKNTFMSFPKDDNTMFYLSLNHIVNSMRFSHDEDMQRVRSDEHFNQLLEEVKLVFILITT